MTHPIDSYTAVLYGDLLTTPHIRWGSFDSVHRYQYIFRQTPVPGTRGIYGHRGSFLRHPRTHAAHRAAERFLSDSRADLSSVHATGGSVAKLRRLPDAWDDLPRGGGKPPRSWKRHRRTQYRARPTIS